MFAGIISDLGQIRAIATTGDRRFEITTRYATGDIDIGASICCSGACMTVIDKGPDWFACTASAETLARTTMGNWRIGRPVNLERCLRMGDEIGGHLVSGHIDGVATVSTVTPDGASLKLVIQAPKALKSMIAAKGSVAIDGVSLTVNSIDAAAFAINIIPHTRDSTTLGNLQAGDAVNLEIDILARYVARLLGLVS
ncbi:MAG TPA: riboflavin synthase [Rhodospirillales bacterium]|jgi:riboflavin synthase|nr:riboflavin synthase [Rhodospirillales bacterium]